MKVNQRNRCHVIIHTAASATAAIGMGLAQLPCADSAAIVPIQIGMIISIGSVFGIRLQQSTAESTLGTAKATLIGRSFSQILIGWIPGFGNVCNAVTAGAVTETLGWAVASDFANRTQNKNQKERKNADHKKSV